MTRLIDMSETPEPDRLFFDAADLPSILGGWWDRDASNLEILSVAPHPDNAVTQCLLMATSTANWGERWDNNPHERLHKRIAPNVAAVMVERDWYETNRPTYPVPTLVVENTHVALRSLGRYVRGLTPATFVQVTGTEGKTGFKYFLDHVMKQQTRVFAQPRNGNLDNPIWRSLASVRRGDAYSIVEIACPAEATGTRRSKRVRPDLCVITNTNPSHLKDHGREDLIPLHKAQSVDGLVHGGTCILNRDTGRFDELHACVVARRPDVRIVTYSASDPDADAFVESATYRDLGWDVAARIDGERHVFRINRVQEHSPVSCTGVLLAVSRLGLDVARAARDLKDFSTPFKTMGALYRLRVGEGTFLFYDQHISMTETALASALSDVRRIQVPGRKIAVIGGELNAGDYARELHERIAKHIDRSDIDMLFTIGDYIEYTVNALQRPERFCGHFFKAEQLAPKLVAGLRPGDLLFIKAVRVLNFQAISQAIFASFPRADGHG